MREKNAMAKPRSAISLLYYYKNRNEPNESSRFEHDYEIRLQWTRKIFKKNYENTTSKTDSLLVTFFNTNEPFKQILKVKVFV